MKTITNIIHTAIALFALAWLALSPSVRAVDPPPDGGYPGQNTAGGEDALFSLTTGVENTAIGFQALVTSTSHWVPSPPRVSPQAIITSQSAI
jgi:hypothetical protein